MSKFDQWWHTIYLDKPKHIYRQCFEEGYDQGYRDGVAAVRILRYVLLGVLALAAVFVLGGCSDHFRYPCQDPTNWEKAECQPPVCSANGTCTRDLITVEIK